MNGIKSYLLLLFFLPSCLTFSSSFPLSSINKTQTQNKAEEEGGRQNEEGERDRREGRVEGREGAEGGGRGHALNSEQQFRTLYNSFRLNWLNTREGGRTESVGRGYYYPHSRPRHPNTPMGMKNVDVSENVNESNPPMTLSKDLVGRSSRSFSLSSSCSSLTCVWFHSWQFLTLLSLLLFWMLSLTTLLCLGHFPAGRHLLDRLSFCCLHYSDDTIDNTEVLAKGIGYFDGSPGMRRFVLIEDFDEEEEEEELKGEEKEEAAGELPSTSNKQEDEEDISSGRTTPEMLAKGWKPPRKGTYILQEATKDYIVEFGTYKLQEEASGEIDEEEDKVEYVLEGATYILQSERVGEGGSEGVIEDLEALYGIINSEKGRMRGIEGLYGIIRQGRGLGWRGRQIGWQGGGLGWQGGGLGWQGGGLGWQEGGSTEGEGFICEEKENRRQRKELGQGGGYTGEEKRFRRRERRLWEENRLKEEKRLRWQERGFERQERVLEEQRRRSGQGGVRIQGRMLGRQEKGSGKVLEEEGNVLEDQRKKLKEKGRKLRGRERELGTKSRESRSEITLREKIRAFRGERKRQERETRGLEENRKELEHIESERNGIRLEDRRKGLGDKTHELNQTEEGKGDNEKKLGGARKRTLILNPSTLNENTDLERQSGTTEYGESFNIGQPGGSGVGQRVRSRSAVFNKRAASFPMDSYNPHYLLPRKLSQIPEEEMY